MTNCNPILSNYIIGKNKTASKWLVSAFNNIKLGINAINQSSNLTLQHRNDADKINGLFSYKLRGKTCYNYFPI